MSKSITRIQRGIHTAPDADLIELRSVIAEELNARHPFPTPEQYLHLPDFERDMVFGIAHSAINEAYLALESVLMNIRDSVLVLEELPSGWRAARLRALFKRKGEFLKTSYDKAINDVVYDLQRAIDNYGPILESEIPGHINREWIASIVEIAGEFRDGVYNLTDPRSKHHDNGESLVQAIADKSEHITAIQESMRAAAKRVGRPTGPAPMTKYVLDETSRIRSVHGTRTGGAPFQLLIKELEKRSDVQAWVAFKDKWTKDRDIKQTLNIDRALKEQSIEVQIYVKYSFMDSFQLGNELRQMKKDNQNYKPGGK
jgi:hypothetical protein